MNLVRRKVVRQMGENEKIEISSAALELSETTNYIELTNRLCYYGEPNLNGVMLPVEGAEEHAKTLVLQPVVAKYKVIANKPDLGGHEYHNGTFGTENIGVHENVEVRTDTVTVNGEQKTLPCLFARSRIWTRNTNVVAAVKRLFNEGRLHSSWEIAVSDYEYKDGIKVLKDYVFESNALLGTNSQPAYGDAASALAMAETEDRPEAIIAEALAKDLGIKEEQSMAEEGVVKETNPVIETPVEPNEGVSEPNKTVGELSAKIGELSVAISEKDAALVAANEKLAEATNALAEYKRYKEKYETLAAEKKQAEDDVVRAEMREKISKSGLFAENEFETSEELKGIMDKADKNALMSVIAERFMKSLEGKPEKETAEVTEQPLKADVSADDRSDNKKFMDAILH